MVGIASSISAAFAAYSGSSSTGALSTLQRPEQQPSLCCFIYNAVLHRIHDCPQHRSSRRSSLRALQGTILPSADEVGSLKRGELQALCKTLGLRAVGKNVEMVERIRETLQYDPPPLSVTSESEKDDVNYRRGETRGVELGVEEIEGRHDFPETVQPGGFVEVLDVPLTVDDLRPIFPMLSERQWSQVEKLGDLLKEWNEKVNLISRKDIANVLGRHVLPCLSLVREFDFVDGTRVLDVGTGGGLPGLPLAICFPRVYFVLIDGKGKKIRAVQDMASKLGLSNVQAVHTRAEMLEETFDFVLGRAVTSLPKFVGWVDKNLRANDKGPPDQGRNGQSKCSKAGRHPNGGLKRGILYLRGEATAEELAELGADPSQVLTISDIIGGDGVIASQMRDRGYSSVFHFTSEAIWSRRRAKT